MMTPSACCAGPRAATPGLAAGKTTFILASSRVREAKPSAAISSRNPKWVVRNVLDAATSSTLSDTADEVILIEPPGLSPPQDPQILSALGQVSRYLCPVWMA